MTVIDRSSASGFVQYTLAARNRPLRLLLEGDDDVGDELLLPQKVVGSQAICGGFEFRILCVSENATLKLKNFIGVPSELQIVTDRGQLRRICGIVTEAASGQSDGGLATYQLTLRDTLSVLEDRFNTRVFRDKNELDIIQILVKEWQGSMPVLARTFALHIDPVLASRQHPARSFIMQHNESDAGFIRRLMQRRGIAWFFRPGLTIAGSPAGRAPTSGLGHTLVLFDDSRRLDRNEIDSGKLDQFINIDRRLGNTGAATLFMEMAIGVMGSYRAGGPSLAVNLRDPHEATFIFISPPSEERRKAQDKSRGDVFRPIKSMAVDPANYAVP